MKDKLFQLLGVEHNEQSLVSVLLFQSVFIGVFYGAFDISAHSLFLAIFDEKVMARAYVVSGLAGIILTTILYMVAGKNAIQKFCYPQFPDSLNPHLPPLVLPPYNSFKSDNILCFCHDGAA